MNNFFFTFFVFGALVGLAISRPTPTINLEPKVVRVAQPVELASKYEQGKKYFRANCMSCHGMLGQGGGMCPPNAHSDLELIRSKVLEGKYPEGYKPKRTTRSMPKFPWLKDHIEEIYEYLKDPRP